MACADSLPVVAVPRAGLTWFFPDDATSEGKPPETDEDRSKTIDAMKAELLSMNSNNEDDE